MAGSSNRACYVALGSNVGDRLRFLSRAVRQLASLEGVQLLRSSNLFSTAPQYVTLQPPFLNAVVELKLSESRLGHLQDLLADLKAIEATLGRTPGPRHGPRPIDLDIVAVGDLQLSTGGAYPFNLPHASMHERDFVLAPMAELCPDWTHPSLLGRPSVRQLLAGLQQGLPQQVLPLAGGLSGRAHGCVAPRGEATLIMGILNMTPDSFSDGGERLQVEEAVAAAQAMLHAGAHVLDVGGESTRPGAAQVSEEEELRRVVPVIGALRELDVTISVDTRKASVARAALASGADWINDVSGGTFDPQMLGLAAELMAPIVLMHARGTPQSMNNLASYTSVVDDVTEELLGRRRAAEAAGVPAWNIILDPGLGFAKTMEHNLALLRHCGVLVEQLRPSPVLVSASRKRFLGTILGETDAKSRIFGNAATTAAAVVAGVDIVRVHDVLEMVQTAKVSDCIYRGGRLDSSSARAARAGAHNA